MNFLKPLISLYWKIKEIIRIFKTNLTKKKVKPIHFEHLSDLPWTEVGDYSYDNGVVIIRFSNKGSIKVGKYCSIAKDVVFLVESGQHKLTNVTTSPLHARLYKINDEVKIGSKSQKRYKWDQELAQSKGPIIIKNDVWIGTRAIIQSGVTIENGAVVLPNSIVTKNIPPYAIYSGVPAKLVRYRFSEDEIHILEQIAWWDWPVEKIKENLSLFYGDISEFIKRFS